MNQYIQAKQADFTKAVDFFKKDISTIRTGRANPSILDGIFVEAYGTKTALVGLASINVPEARSIVITPWDKSITKDIEKAITVADIGVNPVNEGDKIRLVVPQLTEENRKELVKKLSEKMEDARIAMRQIRDEIKNMIEDSFKDKSMNEDDKFRFIKELDEEIFKQNETLKSIKEKKETEIMTI